MELGGPPRTVEPLVEIETLWTVGNEYPEHWPKPQHGWTLTIEGDPSMRAHFLSLASFERDASMLEHVNSANVATAMQVLNADSRGVRRRTRVSRPAPTLPQVHSLIGFGNG